jgi:hypothetical protein
MSDTDIIQFEFVPKLRPGQFELYKLLCRAVAGEISTVTRADAMEIYKTKVAKGTAEVPRRNDDGHTVWVRVDWESWEWERNFEGWFLRSLGLLIKKGYVTVVPVIDLRKVKVTPKLEDKCE